jgi:hypothetical protein
MPKARDDGAGDWLEDRVFLRVPEIEGCSPGPPGSSGWVARSLKIDFFFDRCSYAARQRHVATELFSRCIMRRPVLPTTADTRLRLQEGYCGPRIRRKTNLRRICKLYP